MPPSSAPPVFHDFSRKARRKPIKIFSGVGHGIKKPKPKKSPKLAIEKKAPAPTITPTSTKSTSIGVRQLMKDKFDFSRTPYAIPTPVRRRVALSDESSQKRKFFKTTVEVDLPQPPPKKPKVEEPVVSFEFEETNYIEESELKDVFSILDDWDDEDVRFQPQLTRHEADVLESLPTETTHLSLSYLTPVAIHSEVTDNPQSALLDKQDTDPSPASTPLEKRNTPCRNEENDESPIALPFTPSRKDAGNESPETKLAKMFSVFTPPAKNILSDMTNKNKKTKTALDRVGTPNFKLQIDAEQTTPTTRSALSDMTNKKTKAALDKAAAPNDQMQIDAGQKVIGPVECSSCGMVYDVGDPVDEKRHTDYHAKRYDLKYKKSKSEKVVGICGADRIVLIKYSDDKKRDKVDKILKMTEEEIGCGYTWGPFSMAYIYVRNDRVLGCLIAEPRARASRVIQSDGIVLLSTETHLVKCGVNRIWVRRDSRKKNIATELMNCLRKNFLFGDYLKIDDIAFSATTPDGHAFAVKYTGREDYLAYEETPASVYLKD